MTIIKNRQSCDGSVIKRILPQIKQKAVVYCKWKSKNENDVYLCTI